MQSGKMKKGPFLWLVPRHFLDLESLIKKNRTQKDPIRDPRDENDGDR